MTTIPAGRINSLGMPGPPGPPGEDGAFPLTLPDVDTEEDCIPYTVIEGGAVDFDYIRFDHVFLGDNAVPVGRYLRAAGDNIKTAIQLALAANPTKRLFRLPDGEWSMTAITEASGGLRNDLVFEGSDPLSCILKRTTAGQMFQWVAEAPTNIAFRRITFDFTFTGDPAPFSASINISTGTNLLVEDCRFICSAPDATTDGMRHAINLLGGSNVVMRRCYQDNAQAVLCGLGRSLEGAIYTDNIVVNCNDLGVSAVSDGDTHVIRDVLIARNRFRGVLQGSGFIYVGSDAVLTADSPAEMSDIQILDNTCLGSIGTQLGPASRQGLVLAFCVANKRIKVNGNSVSNTNPSVAAANVYGIHAFMRDPFAMTAWDLEFKNNSIDFRSNDVFYGLRVDGKAVTGLQLIGNKLAAGMRGMYVGGCSNVDLLHNIVEDSTAEALTLAANEQAMTDLRIRHNYLKTSAAFKASVLTSGDNNISRCFIEHNQLRTPQNSVINSLSGGATLTFDYNFNKHEAGLHASAVPDQNIDNQTE